MDTSLLLSRPTSSAVSGKQTAILKTAVTDEVSDAFSKFARDRGYPSVSDCLRELVISAVWGPDYLVDLHRQRIASLALNQTETGTEAPR